MKPTDYLDAAKNARGFESDYELAHELGTTTGCISNYRHGRSVPDVYTMTRLAELAGLDKLEAIAVAELERSKTPERRAHWKRFLHQAAAVLVCMMLIGLEISPAFATGANIHYAQLVAVLAVVYWFTQQPRQRQP